MPLTKLRQYLDSHQIKYLVVPHSLAHLSGKRLAKTVIVKIDGVLTMAVVPASMHVDMDLLRAVTGANVVELATEQEFKDTFPDCQTSAMPPFGNLYAMSVYADAKLAEREQITFTAGTHHELLRMNWADMARLVEPQITNLTQHMVAAG